MLDSRRMVLFFFLAAGFLVVPSQAFAQVSVSPTELYLPPGSPSCGTLWVDAAPVYLEVYTPLGGPEYWEVNSTQTDFCIDGWAEGQYSITGVWYQGNWYPASASFTVASWSGPVIDNVGYMCDNWDCAWLSGSLLQQDSRVEVFSADWSIQQTYYGPAWQTSPSFWLAPEGGWLYFQITDPALLQWFGNGGIYMRVVNSDGTFSAWRWAQAARPTISAGGVECSDKRCVWLSGAFPLNAYVDFRPNGSPDIIPNSYTNLVVSPTLITLRTNAVAWYPHDTAGLNAWAVNPLLANWSGHVYLPPVDRAVVGHIDGVVEVGPQYHVTGWACAKTHAGSIEVHMYVGGPAGGGGTHVYTGMANQPSEPEVAASCDSTGSSYRFSILLTPAIRQQHGGQPIYIHGISPFGLDNLLVTQSGSFAIPTIDLSVTGNFEAVVKQGDDFYLKGWACAKNHSNPIDIQIFVGGPNPGGTFIGAATANQASEPAIAASCSSTGSNYRFWVLIPLSVRQQHAGKPIYIHGMSPFGLPNLLLENSGNLAVPGLGISGVKEYIYLGGRVLAVETTTPP